MLEQYTNDGQGISLITNLFDSNKLEFQQQLQQQQLLQSSTNLILSEIDLEIIKERINVERMKGSHKNALNILSEIIDQTKKNVKT